MTPIRNASFLATALMGATLLAGPAAAQGAEKVRVGLMFTLSGPSAVLGEQGRDGFCWPSTPWARSSAGSTPRW